MNRLFALLIAAALVWGCRTPTPTFDPFQGPPRIPPPGTGQVGQAPPGAGYYSDQPGAAAAAAPARYTPRDGSYQFRSGAVERDDAGRLAGSSEARDQGPGVRGEDDRQAGSVSDQSSGVSTAVYEHDATEGAAEQGRVRQAANWEQGEKPARYDARIRVVEPAAKTEASPPSDQIREPARFEPTGPLTEISELPKSRAAAPARAPRATIRAASDRTTRASPAGDEGGTVAPSRLPSNSRRTASAPTASRQPYGYDPQYHSLQGRLEFSESENRWKLRYIPIDGQTDKFGGSVVLPDSPQLDGFKAGDFVTVEGTVGKKDPRSRGFAPDYQVQRITQAQ